MVAHPLRSVSTLLAGEDVPAHLGPVVDAGRDLDGLVFLMIGWIHAADLITLALRGEIGVQLHHGAMWGNSGGAVDLNLVIALRMRGPGCRAEEEQQQADPTR